MTSLNQIKMKHKEKFTRFTSYTNNTLMSAKKKYTVKSGIHKKHLLSPIIYTSDIIDNTAESNIIIVLNARTTSQMLLSS